MKIKLSITGPLRKPTGDAEMELTVDNGKNIEQILTQIGYKEDELRHILCFVNEKPVAMSEHIKEKDALLLTILIGGG